MALWGDAPRFGKGTGGTLLGGEVFVDILSQTQASVGPGSYNINAKSKKVTVPKLTPQMSAPKTPRRWNQPQLHSQESRVAASASASSLPPSNRHSYLYSTMSHGLEIYRSDVGLIPGPGAYGGKIVGDWDEPRRKAKADAAAAMERGRAPSPSKHFTAAKRPDPTVLATAVVRDDILIVHKTDAVPGPGMYGRLYDRRSPWITRSFNVRVRTGNSPVRPRPTSCISPSSSPAAHVPRSGHHNNTTTNQHHSTNNRRSATPQPVRSAWASPRREEAGSTPQAASIRGQTPRSLATQSMSSEYPPQRTRDRRQSTRAQELESWWEQVMTRTYSPRHSTVRSPRLA